MESGGLVHLGQEGKDSEPGVEITQGGKISFGGWWTSAVRAAGDGWFENVFMELIFLCVCAILGLHPWHIEVPRLGVKLELRLPAYTTAIAMQDPSCICNLTTQQGQGSNLHPYGSWSGSLTTEPRREFLFFF